MPSTFQPTIQAFDALPPAPTLAPPERGSVDLWLASLTGDSAEFEPLLTDDEKRRANAFHFEVDRKKFIIGRGRLRILLGRYLRCDPATVSIEPGKNLKPRLANSGGKLDFNLSHSGDHVLYAVTSGESVGVDLESIHREGTLPDCAKTICSEEELPRLRRLPSDRLPRALLRLWTAKEAFLKALGTGLHLPPDQLEIPSSITDGSPDSTTLLWLESPEVSGRYRIYPMPECERRIGYSAAVALEQYDPKD
ncbi:MAG: 4'-phosphopantetheinyl transferase superfamily protein [Verrucomicrobiae bacterium]|nr:4'-phosphopantetheinyl transferase superfamily protein [Verrucomicrobiae bacterium]